MGRRATQSSLSLQNNQPEANWDIVISPYLWDEGNNSYGDCSLRTEIPKKANFEAITKDLVMTDELRETAAVLIASYQQRLKNLYNRHVKPRAFRAGDLVLRRVFENLTDLVVGKF